MGQPDERAPQEPQKPSRTPVTRQNYQSLLDQRFAQAQADGLLDNLPGQGQPLKLDDDSLVPEEDRAGYRLLKASGFAPPWMEVRREIDAERGRLNAWLAEANRRWGWLDEARRAKLRADYQGKLDELRRMILNYNLSAPRGAEHIEGLRLDEELRKLGEQP